MYHVVGMYVRTYATVLGVPLLTVSCRSQADQLARYQEEWPDQGQQTAGGIAREPVCVCVCVCACRFVCM